MQAAMNARLRQSVDSPALTALLSFIVGVAVLAILTISGTLGRGTLRGLDHAPWWAWLGGLSGAFSVIMALVAVPRAGAAVVIGAALLGQSIASLAIDHYGWLDVPRFPINTWRIIGTILLFVGVLMIQYRR
jgi:bacterial/archaeal transporter family-2 protein